MLAEIIFGNYITDPVDQQCLNSVVDYWISPNAIKRDFELPKCKSYFFILFLITNLDPLSTVGGKTDQEINCQLSLPLSYCTWAILLKKICACTCSCLTCIG